MSLAEALPAAVGIAANPPAVIAVLLLLSSSTSKRTAAGERCDSVPVGVGFRQHIEEGANHATAFWNRLRHRE